MSGKYTEAQRTAIRTRNKNLLVSAAAGSGKTMVLVDRILELITEGEADVDEMLIVTFTNLAATEMKLKINRALKKAMARDSDIRERLSSQSDKLYRAYISTFDKFSGRIIKEFFYKAEVSPNYSICDNIREELFMRDAVTALFDEMFQNDLAISGISFKEFLRTYSDVKSEEELKKQMIFIYKKLRSIPNYFSWAEEKLELLKIPEGGYKESAVYKEFIQNIRGEIIEASKIENLYIPLFDESLVPKIRSKLEAEREELREIAKLSESEEFSENVFELIRKRLSEFKFVTLRGTKEEKEHIKEISNEVKQVRDKTKKLIKNINKEIEKINREDLFVENERTQMYSKYYIDLLRRFEEIYSERKKIEGMMDFADVNHFALKILNDDEARAILRKRFKYIFIDEYQDTNYLQESIISKIARENNLFKVGDVKQSIYRFRQAQPQIFIETMDRYEKEEESSNIILSHNFRSNPRTIDFINEVFKPLMKGYDENSALNAGLSGFGDYDYKPEVHFICLNDENDKGNEEKIQENDGKSGEDENNKIRITKDEKEAEYIADIIDDMLGKKFYDSKLGVIREVQPKDIVVLMRSVKKMGGTIYRKLLERGISSYVNEEDGFFDTVEIEVFLALLNVIDNDTKEVPLVAVLHSEIFNFTADELAEIRAEYNMADELALENRKRDNSYRMALLWYEENKKNKLSEKIRDAFLKIREWRSYNGLMPTEDYLWYLMKESRYYIYAGAMNDGVQRQANLRVLIDRALNYRLNGITTLGGYIKYLNILKKNNVKTGEATIAGENDNLVRIMTIHKSKGLEFPFVIVSGLSKKLRTERRDRGMIMDSSIGLGLSYVDRDKGYRRSSLMQELILNSIKKKDIEEEIRVLYVALTRARQKLILTATVGDRLEADSFLDKPWNNPSEENFISMMRNGLRKELCDIHISSNMSNSKRSRKRRALEYFEKRDRGEIIPPEELLDEVERRLDYIYEYKKDTMLKAKYSVSELNSKLNLEEDAKEDRYINLARKEGDELAKNAISRIFSAELGTAYHRLMEYLDFGKLVGETSKNRENKEDIEDREDASEYIKDSLEYLVSTKAISEELAKSIDLDKICNFFNSEIGREAGLASKNGRLYKEKAFTLEMDRDGSSILVQGIIDCLFLEGDRAVLIDYKSNKMRDNSQEEKNRIKEMYKAQVKIYEEAVIKGLNIEKIDSYLYLFDIGEFTKV